MSSASTATNTCSNYLSDQKNDGHSLYSEKNLKTDHYKKINSEIFENEEPDIDSYFNNNFTTKLDNIAYNFMESSSNNTLTESSKNFQTVPYPIIKKSNTSQIESSVSGSNLAKMTSLKSSTLLNSNQRIKDTEIKKDTAKHHTKESNPFLESSELEKSHNSVALSNPFEDETTDDSNPFINNESSEITTIEIDKNFNIKLSSKNDELGENNQSNKTSKDLLDWCKDIVQCSKLLNYKLLNELEVNDFASSWTNGIAFCVIIHHFRPSLM